MPAENRSRDKIDSRFDTVYDATYDEIRRFIASKVADPSNIPDILQDVYLEYYNLLVRKGCNYPQSDKALIMKIAGRRVMRYYSFRQRMRRIIPLHRYDRTSGEELEYDIPSPLDIEDQIFAKEELEDVDRIISSFPTDTRKVLYLYFAEEMKLQEIAKAMDLSLQNVKNKLYRALGRIRSEGRREKYDK